MKKTELNAGLICAIDTAVFISFHFIAAENFWQKELIELIKSSAHQYLTAAGLTLLH